MLKTKLKNCVTVQCTSENLKGLIRFLVVDVVVACNGSDAGPRNEHVFISYAYTFQDDAIVIRDRLKEAGFKVWIDIDDMRTYIASALCVREPQMSQRNRATL